MSIPIIYTDDSTKKIEGTFPIVILGPNGSGKTRYGRNLAIWNKAEIIPALRNIRLDNQVTIAPISEATSGLVVSRTQLINNPWLYSQDINNLFAKLLIENSNSAIEFRNNKYKEKNDRPEVTKLMRLQEVWESLFPGRHISFLDYEPKVTNESVVGENVFPAGEISDGERAALYLAGRVLNSNPGVIIIDEPEVHFHSRLAIQFWNELERLRDDCRFVYITHDLTFARSREKPKFLIVRPNKDPELVDNSGGDIPADITESILSAASFSIFADRLIFCEGNENSHDQRLMRAWYKERNIEVIPVGSCRDVIRCAKTFRESRVLSGIKAIGIIDYDYWPETFLSSLPLGISVLPVHEIESIFCIREVFIALAQHLGKEDAESNQLYEEFLKEAKSRFVNELKLQQIEERVKRRCEDQIHKAMNTLTLKGPEIQVIDNFCSVLSPEKWEVHPKTIFEEEKSLIENALKLNSSDEDFLKYLPGKVYFPILVDKLGVKRSFNYVDLIVKSLKSNSGEKLYDLGCKIRIGLEKIFPDV